MRARPRRRRGAARFTDNHTPCGAGAGRQQAGALSGFAQRCQALQALDGHFFNLADALARQAQRRANFIQVR
jgi:hypothetical protein